MRVQPTADHALTPRAKSPTKPALLVADRLLSVPAGDCRGLARAVGVWASLVLEQELARGHSGAGTASASQTPYSSGSRITTPGSRAADSQSPDAPWPAPVPFEKPPAEGEWYLHHDDTRTLEIGVAGFLMSGAGAGRWPGRAVRHHRGRAGASSCGPPFRRAVAAGAEQPSDPDALWVAGRFDACLRVPGLYNENRGMQLDLCGGADFGFLDDSTDDVTLPFVSVGPSLDLRGELGSSLSAAIRAVTGINLTSETIAPVYQPLWSGRLELAFSWKVK